MRDYSGATDDGLRTVVHPGEAIHRCRGVCEYSRSGGHHICDAGLDGVDSSFVIIIATGEAGVLLGYDTLHERLPLIVV